MYIKFYLNEQEIIATFRDNYRIETANRNRNDSERSNPMLVNVYFRACYFQFLALFWENLVWFPGHNTDTFVCGRVSSSVHESRNNNHHYHTLSIFVIFRETFFYTKYKKRRDIILYPLSSYDHIPSNRNDLSIETITWGYFDFPSH